MRKLRLIALVTSVLVASGCGKGCEGPSPSSGGGGTSSDSSETPTPKFVKRPPTYRLTPLVSRTLEPSSQDQIVSYKDAVTVTVPGDTVKQKEDLVISSVENAPAPGFRGLQHLAVYDIALGKPRPLDKELTIEIAYDGSKAKGYAVWMETWDDAQEVWVTLPSEVDTQRKIVRTRTRHLCPVAVASAEQIADTNGRAVLPADKDKWYYANEYFVMSFIKSEIEASTCDKKNPKGFKEYVDPAVPVYHEDMPRFVESVWCYVNQARENYGSSSGAGLRDLPKFDETAYVFKGGTNIFVGGGGSSSRNKFTGNVSVSLDTVSAKVLKFSCAHELFHSVQNQYYNCSGMTSRKWWMECTADYAAEKIARCGDNQMGGDRINPRHFEKCLTYSSSAVYDAASGVEGGARELVGVNPDKVLADNPHGYHEYTCAYFIDFLVEKKGIGFKEMFEEVAKSYNPWTETPLDDFLKTKGTSLAECYREYVRGWLFDPQSPIYSRCAVKDAAGELTDPKAPTDLPTTEGEMSAILQVEGGHAAKLWAFKVALAKPDDPGVATSDRVTVQITESLRAGLEEAQGRSKTAEPVAADIYVLKGGKPERGGQTPAATIRATSLEPENASAQVQIGEGDVVGVLVFNHASIGDALKVKVTRPVLRMKYAHHIETYVIDSEHKFAVMTEKSGLPEDAQYSWNFGDGSGGAGLECAHKYTGAGTFPITVSAGWKDGSLTAKSRITIADDKEDPKKAEANIYVFRYFKNKMGKSKRACQSFHVTVKNAKGEIIDGGDADARNGLFSIVLPVGRYSCVVGYTYTSPDDKGTASANFDVKEGDRNWCEIETPPYEAFDR